MADMSHILGYHNTHTTYHWESCHLSGNYQWESYPLALTEVRRHCVPYPILYPTLTTTTTQSLLSFVTAREAPTGRC